jgi:uncharacterized membrane protein required for colicin V production
MVCATAAALTPLLPTKMRGELTSGQMAQHDPSRCQTCPRGEQIESAGWITGEDGLSLTVRFADAPANTQLRIYFAGVRDALELQQVGTSWRSSQKRFANAPTPVNLSQRKNRVVVTFPGTFHTSGIAVATNSGDRIPASGFVGPRRPPVPHFNVTDVVIVTVLIATACYGYRRGILVEMMKLVMVIVGVGITILAYRPVVRLATQVIGDEHVAEHVAALLGPIVLAVVLATGRFFAASRISLRPGTATGGFNRAVTRFCGAAAASLRQFVLLAIILRSGIEIVPLQWAIPSIDSSLFGAAILHAWRIFGSGT